MDNPQTVERIALDAFRGRIVEIIPAQIKAAVEELSEDQLWWRPNEKSNSVGNLVLHLSGSVRHYLARGLGGYGYERDRPAEFSERGPVAKQELVAIFDETIRLSKETLDSFDPARFSEASEEPSYTPTIFHLLLNISVHMATHAGQIVYIAKMLKEGSIDELWIRAHKDHRKNA